MRKGIRDKQRINMSISKKVKRVFTTVVEMTICIVSKRPESGVTNHERQNTAFVDVITDSFRS
jgi:hypothetical protein